MQVQDIVINFGILQVVKTLIKISFRGTSMFKKIAAMAIILATTNYAFAAPKWMHSLQRAVRAALTTSAQKQVPQKTYVIDRHAVDVANIKKTTQFKLNNLYRQTAIDREIAAWDAVILRAKTARLNAEELITNAAAPAA